MPSTLSISLSRTLPIGALWLALSGSLLAGCLGAAQAAPDAADNDPAHTDGDKYQVLLENGRVRVLHYRDQPGDTTHPHRHPDFVLYALAPFKRELTFPDGTRRTRVFAAGEVAFMPAQGHVGHNVGTTPTDALLIELKPVPTGATPR